MYPLLVSAGPIGLQTAGVVAIIALWVAVEVAAKELARRGHGPARFTISFGPPWWWTSSGRAWRTCCCSIPLGT